MKNILTLLCCLLSLAGISHPGIGIVRDSKGNIFYTDLKQVWKIARDGKKTIAVHNVHTHELALDVKDNLYGEHLWYNGEKLDTWGHYFWCLKNDGTLVNIKEATEGFPENYGFLRDTMGNMYWVERFTVSKFKKKAPNGTVSTIASRKFGNIRWSYCTKSGVIYFVDLHKLYRIEQNGSFRLIAEDLDDGKLAFGFSRQHNVYGIWTDQKDNIYVTIMSQKKVKRITPQGKVEVIAYSTGPWSPSSGVFDEQGNLWLLETANFGDTRVRKIEASALTSKPNKFKPVLMNYAILGLGIGVVAVAGYGVFKLIKFIGRRFRQAGTAGLI